MIEVVYEKTRASVSLLQVLFNFFSSLILSFKLYDNVEVIVARPE